VPRRICTAIAWRSARCWSPTQTGDWVLLHAGFAIQTLDEQEAQETWAVVNDLRAIGGRHEFHGVFHTQDQTNSIAAQAPRRGAAGCSRPAKFMEVCGTHTMSAFRCGLHSLMPSNVTLLSGPGCPVCVTSQGDIDQLIEIGPPARRHALHVRRHAPRRSARAEAWNNAAPRAPTFGSSIRRWMP
jgi:hypothetical protein